MKMGKMNFKQLLIVELIGYFFVGVIANIFSDKANLNVLIPTPACFFALTVVLAVYTGLKIRDFKYDKNN